MREKTLPEVSFGEAARDPTTDAKIGEYQTENPPKLVLYRNLNHEETLRELQRMQMWTSQQREER